MFKRIMLGLTLAVALVGGQAAAAEQNLFVLNVDGQAIRFPVPKGLCPASGLYADVADKIAKLDNENETLLTLYRCADMAANKFDLGNYMIIKMPKAGRGQTIPLASLLDAYRQAPEMFGEAVEGIDNRALGDTFSEAFEEKITVGGGIKVAGADERGIYLIGNYEFQGDDRKTTTTLATGITSVKGKVLGVNLYGPGGEGEIAKRLREAKSAVTALLAAN